MRMRLKMTIREVIDEVEKKKTGYVVTEQEVIESINRVEEYALNTIIKGRLGEEEARENYGGYSKDTPTETALLIPAPWDTVYADFCCAQLDKAYEDSERYAADMAAYNSAMTDFKRYWWASHRQSKLYRYNERGI